MKSRSFGRGPGRSRLAPRSLLGRLRPTRFSPCSPRRCPRWRVVRWRVRIRWSFTTDRCIGAPRSPMNCPGRPTPRSRSSTWRGERSRTYGPGSNRPVLEPMSGTSKDARERSSRPGSTSPNFGAFQRGVPPACRRLDPARRRSWSSGSEFGFSRACASLPA